MIKKSTGYLKYIAILALVAALVALTVWVKGMYHSSTVIYMQTTDNCLAQATDKELKMRIVALGENFYTWFTPHKKGDTSAYINRSIEVDDGRVYHIRIRKDDPTAITKVRQFGFHLIDCRLNVADVDSLFKSYMAEESLPVKSGYMEFLDLEKDSLISSNAPEGKLRGYVASDIDTLDIFKTLGVRAHIKTSAYAILKPVMGELILAVVLILLVMACIIKLTVDIRRLHREGFRFLRVLSRTTEQSLDQAGGEIREISGKLHAEGKKEDAEKLDKAHEAVVANKNYFETLRLIMDNEEGKITFEYSVVSLKFLLEELKEKYEKVLYKEVMVTISMDLDVFMYTDEKYLKRILEELFDNSVKYSGNVVMIHIRAVQEKNKILIVVCDNGWGIKSSDLENIYIINRRVAGHLQKNEIRNNEKAGLGLSFVSSFVRSLGGEIEIKDLQGMTGIMLFFKVTDADRRKIVHARKHNPRFKPDFMGKMRTFS